MGLFQLNNENVTPKLAIYKAIKYINKMHTKKWTIQRWVLIVDNYIITTVFTVAIAKIQQNITFIRKVIIQHEETY